MQGNGGWVTKGEPGKPVHCSMDRPLVTEWAGLQPRPQAPPRSARSTCDSEIPPHQHNQPAPPNQPTLAHCRQMQQEHSKLHKICTLFSMLGGCLYRRRGLCREMGAGSQKGNRGNLCTVPWTGPWLQNGRDCNQGRKPRPDQRDQPATPKSRPISITNPRPPNTNQPSRTVDKCNKSIPSYTKSVHYSACWVRQDVAWRGGVGQRAAGQDRAGQGAAERSRVAANRRGEAGHGRARRGAAGRGGARRGAAGRGGARRSAAGAAGGAASKHTEECTLEIFGAHPREE